MKRLVPRLALFVAALAAGMMAAVAAYNADVLWPEFMRLLERVPSPPEPRLPSQDDPARMFFVLPRLVS